MLIRQLFDAETWSYTYLLADTASGEAALVDPVREQLMRDSKLLDELGLKLRYVLETHVHADHVTSAGAMADKTGAATVASPGGAACATVRVRHGDVLMLGRHAIQALATPGHTPDSMSFLADGNVFTGDALLVRGTGRTDFQGGDAGQLYDAITRVLFQLPDETLVWPAHDYRGHTQSTIREERLHNPRLSGKSREEFRQIMLNLNLPAPKKIHEAVPANLLCGRAAIA